VSDMAWVVVGLLDEEIWAILAAAGSFLLTLGLAVRRLSSAPRARLGANTAAAIGAFVRVTGGSMAAVARHLRVSSRPAVVVVNEARPTRTRRH
jgi:hypothetical protein